MTLDGQLAVVTGASRGIGLATAFALEAAGSHVVRIARSLRAAQTPTHTDVPCDVTDAEAVERVADEVVKQHGAPDILVLGAGGFFLQSLVDTGPKQFADQLNVNLTGSFVVLRAFVKPMIQRGSGTVIMIGSIADHEAFAGNAAYSASKFGLRGLHEVLRVELRDTGVRATLLCPGPVSTTIWDSASPESLPGFRPAHMLKVDDVVEAVLFVVTRPAHVTVPELHIEPRQ